MFNLTTPKGISEIKFAGEEDLVTCNIYGEINDESIKEVQASLRTAIRINQEIIPVVIHSAGGDMYSGMALYSLLRECKKKVVTILLGKAFSAAAFIFCCGDERYMSPNATLMFHQVRIETLTGEHEMIKREAKEVYRLNKEMLESISLHCGHDDSKFLFKMCEKIRGDVYINAKKAKRHLFADYIGIPTININVKTKWSISL